MRPLLKVAMVASEAFPFVKVGGLADVIGALPVHLKAQGLDVAVYLPWHKGIGARNVGTVRFYFEGREQEASVGEAFSGGVPFYFIGLPEFFRDQIYGYWDDEQRFVKFSMAAAALIDADIVHAHDWQTAVIPALASAGRLRGASTVFTIHNLAYQGRWNAAAFYGWTGLPWTTFTLDGLEYYGEVNLMKGGIVYADRVTTVSPSYAGEIQTPPNGVGLDGILRRHAHKLVGILNGLDVEYWDPTNDRYIPAHYSMVELEGKRICQRELEREMGLDPPVLGVVSRLVSQKGIDLVVEALPEILQLGFSLAVLGSGESWLERSLSEAAHRNPRRVAFSRGYDEPLAHRIYAGAEAFLMPSRYEPCGLTQMIAQRYGSPPIARSVGGLRDTVEDGRTGMLFETAHPEGLVAGISRFLHHPDRQAIVREAMHRDFSWESAARQYVDLYKDIARG